MGYKFNAFSLVTTVPLLPKTKFFVPFAVKLYFHPFKEYPFGL